MIFDKSFFSNIFIFAAIQSLFLTFVLLRKPRNTQKKILATLLFFLSWTLIGYYFGINETSYAYYLFPEIAWFSISPTFYLLTKATIHKTTPLKETDIIFFIIPIYNFIQAMLYLLGFDILLYHLMDTFYYSIFFLYLYIVSSIILNQMSLNTINSYIVNARNELSAIDKKVYILKYYFLSFQFFLILFFVLQSYTFYQETYSLIIEFCLLILFALFILVIAYKTMTESSFLSYETIHKYKNSNISDQDFAKIEKKLKNYVTEHKPFINPELKLTSLAEAISVKANILSQLFTQKMNLRFYDYINNCRLDEFLKRVDDKKYHHFTIESIASDSGFKHKTVFYKYFKERFNKSPKEYLKDRINL